MKTHIDWVTTATLGLVPCPLLNKHMIGGGHLRPFVSDVLCPKSRIRRRHGFQQLLPEAIDAADELLLVPNGSDTGSGCRGEMGIDGPKRACHVGGNYAFRGGQAATFRLEGFLTR